MSRHRQAVRPRYGRIAAAGSSSLITLVAVLGGAGLMPVASSAENPSTAPSTSGSAATAAALAKAGGAVADARGVAPRLTLVQSRKPLESSDVVAPPADSGSGRRVVFSESGQRVWLIDAAGDVRRTYLVSGSVTDNLQPGTYEVYSRSEQAWGVDNSGTMKYFVRFTEGPQGGAIGFHTIPEVGGQPAQSLDELGTPQSHGCIRQAQRDALALWDFAPTGTPVVVTA